MASRQITIAAVIALAALSAACTQHERRVATGAGIGTAAGATVGAVATGTGTGAVVGGAIGAASGALIANATSPHR
ncbi:glycine zipper domain-containing protein [Segnochrobactraceae bacterium EtOH-i3]